MLIKSNLGKTHLKFTDALQLAIIYKNILSVCSSVYDRKRFKDICWITIKRLQHLLRFWHLNTLRTLRISHCVVDWRRAQGVQKGFCSECVQLSEFKSSSSTFTKNRAVPIYSLLSCHTTTTLRVSVSTLNARSHPSSTAPRPLCSQCHHTLPWGFLCQLISYSLDKPIFSSV